MSDKHVACISYYNPEYSLFIRAQGGDYKTGE